MAKKIKIDSGHMCDDCIFADWHTQQWNFDLQGNPITFGCQKEVFEQGVVIGTRKACELWANSKN